MKKSTALFFQIVVVFIGIGALTFMLWEPHLEGRNINATVFQIYFQDPFLAYAYVASIPFFITLYHVFKILGSVGQNKISVVKSLRIIKYCAMAMIGFVVLGEIFILQSNSDDHAGGVVMGTGIALFAITMAVAAMKLERYLGERV